MQNKRAKIQIIYDIADSRTIFISKSGRAVSYFLIMLIFILFSPPIRDIRLGKYCNFAAQTLV